MNSYVFIGYENIGGKTMRGSIYKDTENLNMPEFSVYTNYRKGTKKAVWYTVGNARWEFEQINEIPFYAYSIPFINSWTSKKYYRKYELYRNNKRVGELNQYEGNEKQWEAMTIDNEDYHFLFDGEKSTLREGWGKNGWSIKKSTGEEIAFIKKGKKNGYFIINIQDGIEIEVVAILVMSRNILTAEKSESFTYISR